MALHEWGAIDDDKRRLSVPGGWIYHLWDAGQEHVVFVPEPAASRIANDEAMAELVEASEGLKIIASHTGPAAPMFDLADWEGERARGTWYSVDGTEYDRLRAALAKLKGTA